MSSMEIYMGKKMIFPYNLLDGIKSYIEEDSETYNLYFVLLGDRYEIVDKYPHGINYIVKCQNMRSKAMFKASINIPDLLGFPNSNCIETTVYGNKSLLGIRLSKYGEELLRISDNQNYILYRRNCEKSNFIMTIHSSTLFSKFRVSSQQEHVKYKVLYIGKSETMFTRLSSHSTIQTICREHSYSDSNSDIFIMVSGVHGKLIEDADSIGGNISVTLGYSLPDQFKLYDEAVSRKQLIDIAEAMLISTFFPKYNDKLKKQQGKGKLETYRRLGKTELKKVHFSLDLTFDESNTLIVLETLAQLVKGVATVITCEFLSDGQVAMDLLCLP